MRKITPVVVGTVAFAGFLALFVWVYLSASSADTVRYAWAAGPGQVAGSMAEAVQLWQSGPHADVACLECHQEVDPEQLRHLSLHGPGRRGGPQRLRRLPHQRGHLAREDVVHQARPGGGDRGQGVLPEVPRRGAAILLEVPLGTVSVNKAKPEVISPRAFPTSQATSRPPAGCHPGP